jgi:hypothetical protein
MKSRKFLLTLLILAIGVLTNHFDQLTPQLLNLLLTILGLYHTANVGQKAVEAAKQWFAQKATETP